MAHHSAQAGEWEITLLLKDAGFVAIRGDLAWLTIAAVVMITVGTMLLKRTL